MFPLPAILSLLILVSPVVFPGGFALVSRASAAQCDDGSSLASRIDLAAMESEVGGDKTLARLLTRTGLQLAGADALVDAKHLKGAKRKLRGAMRSLTRGNFYCVNDSFATVNPTIDFNNPAGGSYDVWIGSYAANTTISGTLYLTENSGNHP
jgi:hypothetical protein